MLRHSPVVGLREVGSGRSRGRPLGGVGSPPGRKDLTVRLARPCRTEPVRGRAAPRRLGRRASAAVAALAVALMLVASVVVASLTAGPVSAATSCTGPLAGGQIRVVVVVDPGETGPRAPAATCLVVAAGTSGSKILAQRASELGLPSPRYADSGLLCGIDGFPGTGCPVNSGGTYAYWAYFNGSGGMWSYGHDNPFVRRMVDGEIMGWRYTTGSRDGDAPMPRISPTSALFPALAPPPTAPPSGGGGAGGTAGGSAAGGLPALPALPDLSGLATPTTVADAGATGGTATTVAPDGSTTSSADGAVTRADGAEELAAEPAASTGSSPTRWIGPVSAVAVAGALGVGALTRSRRRAQAGG